MSVSLVSQTSSSHQGWGTIFAALVWGNRLMRGNKTTQRPLFLFDYETEAVKICKLITTRCQVYFIALQDGSVISQHRDLVEI